MAERIQELINRAYRAKQRSVGLQHRIFMYLLVMLLIVFFVLLIFLSISGIFSGSKDDLLQILNMQQANIVTDLNEQLNRLVAQGVSTSEEITQILGDQLHTKPISALNDDAEKLYQLESTLYGSLNTALRSNPCSGAYVVLNATINTASENAQNSRAGLYLRFANLSDKNQVNQDVTLYRGIANVSRENRLELHNRWRLEFDTSKLPGYANTIAHPVNRPIENYTWNDAANLSDTWENIILLSVPVIGNDGSVAGMCGFEISDLYFRLSYPSKNTEWGNMVTILAPIKNGELQLSKGLVGGSNGISLDNAQTLLVEERKNFCIYTGTQATFLGVQNKIDMKTADGSDMYVISILPKDQYSQSAAIVITTILIALLIFFTIMVLLSAYLSQRIVQPISRSISVLQNDDAVDEERSGIEEIDVLMSYIRKKSQMDESGLPADIAELFDHFAERAATLTSTERNIIKHYADGKDVSEVAELAFISINTVRKHNANIYQKLEVGSRDELLLYIELFRRCDRLHELC